MMTNSTLHSARLQASYTQLLIVCLIAGSAAPVRAQDALAPQRAGEPALGAPLQLAVLQREAREADARTTETELLASQTDLRLRNIAVERLPAITALGQSQYQSDVPTAPFTLPNGQPAFAPPKFSYDASLRIDQRLYDPSIEPRRALARAELAESQARVRSSVYGLRQDVNEAFFTAALMQEQLGALQASIDDLDARLRETNVRVREGAALVGEAAALEATRLRYLQQADELRATRAAALARLSTLTGRSIPADARIAQPDLGAAAARARTALATLRARPEYEQFARTRDRAARQQDLAAAADRPQLSAFARAGYGRPGLNFINDRGESYALGGVQLQWKAWNWNTSSREREALMIQQDIVSADESAFTSALRRGVESDLATIDRLRAASASDDRIIELREAIDRTARVRLQEGVTTAADYLDRRTEWLTAQFDRARHRVELAYAQARLLTTLGLEVQ
jgi:outer membrane protein TolC